MSESATPSYQWGHEHFCEPDVVRLNSQDRDIAAKLGYPVQLEEHPDPATFCSVCLNFFTIPPVEGGSETRPPG